MITPRFFGLALLKKKFSSLLQFFYAATPNFRYGVVLFFACFLLGVSGLFRDFLVPTASDILTFRVWKLVSAPFIEPNVFLFAWSVLSLHQFLTYIEPGWGTVELLKYLGIVQILTTLCVALLALFCFACFQALNFFFYVPICGLPIVSISALVSLKQFLPDTVVLTTPYGRLKNGHLPLSAVFASLLLWLFGLLRGGVPLQIALGLQISWTYLRFFRVAGPLPTAAELESGAGVAPGTAAVVGDENEHFTWARTQPLASAIGNGMFKALVSLKICKRLKDLDLNSIDNALQSTYEAAAGAFDGRDAERKRQKALRVLNERLSSVVSTGGAARPGPSSSLSAAGGGLATSYSSPRLPSSFSASARSAASLRRDDSAEEAPLVGGIQMGSPPTTPSAAMARTAEISEDEHLMYGVASNPSPTISGKPLRFLTRMDSESTTASVAAAIGGAEDSTTFGALDEEEFDGERRNDRSQSVNDER